VTRLAVIGCGAVTELYHLPAVRLAADVEIVALVDERVDRARTLSERFGILAYADSLAALSTSFDGVVLAVPNHLHAPMALDLLARRLPVLVEKPMALTAADAGRMMDAAATSGTVLQIGHMYRFCRGAKIVRQCLRGEALGPLRSFSMEFGVGYDWPVASDFVLSRATAGGGVFIDMGSHVLDLLRWWLGDVSLCDYVDDSLGGVESDCLLTAVVETATGQVRGEVGLSRVRNLGTLARFSGDRWTLEYDLMTPDTVVMRPSRAEGIEAAFSAFDRLAGPQSWDEVYAEQLESFAASIHAGVALENDASAALWTVSAIERCYAGRRPEVLPWLADAMTPNPPRVI
jgi:predicted dehydrogenase